MARSASAIGAATALRRRIVWSRAAREELRDIIAYLQTTSPAYARSFALRLQQRTKQLEDFPLSGRFVPEDPTRTYRELILGNHRLIYRHEGDAVTIITLVHGARMSPS